MKAPCRATFSLLSFKENCNQLPMKCIQHLSPAKCRPQATPELIINGEKVSNVCDNPRPYLAMAADRDLAIKLQSALDAAQLMAGT